tara:strand:- start:589 stop:783 length:195 start_codon:yes stop_codon:yes gene_type:complete
MNLRMGWLPDSFHPYNLRRLNRDRKWEERLKRSDEECEENNLRMKYGNKKVGDDWKKFKKEMGL